MPIRISGLNSGMDTDTMVKELIKASSIKKDDMVKEQTKLKWQQDAWKGLNTKIHSFFNKYLDNMRFSTAYNKKATAIADTGVASVVASDSAVNGSQTLAVKELAKSAYMTGGKIDTGIAVKGATTLKEMGLVSGAEKATMAITIDGIEKTIEMTADMTLEQLTQKMNEAGVIANFDEKNQRLFISAKNSGAAGNFEITAKDAGGAMAISALGLSGSAPTDADTLAWAAMKPNATATPDEIKAGVDFQTKVTTETARRIAIMQGNRDKLQQKLEETLNSEAYKEAIKTEGATIDEKIKKLEADYKENEDILTDADKAVYKERIESLVKVDEYGKMITEQDKYLTAEHQEKIKAVVENEYVSKVNTAYKATQTPTGDKLPVKIDGQDAKIVLNGAEFTSNSNTFNVNGLAITAQTVSKTDTAGNFVETSINTADDIDGIYNLVKDFLKEYNSLMKEMDTLYNASAAKGLEPLTSEEKAALPDKEVEEWEKKIKDSILRRDNNLGSVTNLLKTSMLAGVEIDGKRMSLTDFGIELPSYFNAGANERNLYHIAGDKDDVTSTGQKDKLRKAIAGDPEQFKKFFSEFSNKMYEAVNKEMKSVKGTRSVYHVYDDKRMESEYKEYGTEIKDQEAKLKRLEEKYYAQFAAMEKAMSQMNSQQSALSSLLGQ